MCRIGMIARHFLTLDSNCGSLVARTENKANHAECANTLRGSDPTLSIPVNGLHRIIANRGTPVLLRFCGPTDNRVGLGRFVVLVKGSE